MADDEATKPTITTHEATTYIAKDPFSRRRMRMGLLHARDEVSVFGYSLEDHRGKEVVSMVAEDDGATVAVRYDDTNTVEVGVNTDIGFGFLRLMDRGGAIRVEIVVHDNGEIETTGLERFLTTNTCEPDA